MKRDITNELPANIREQLDFLAKSFRQRSFFIQDTETTGVGDLDQIHDFAGLYYDKGRVYKIQYYVVQPNDKDENGIIHVDFNALRKLHKDSPAFKYMMGTEGDSNEAYRQMREAMDKKVWDENDPMISRENLALLLKNRYAKVPNFAYNATFDIKMEKKLESAINSKIKFSQVYDVMTIALSTMPEIMSKNMGKELSVGKLEKVYKYLDETYPEEFKKFKTTTQDGQQEHTAWSDIFNFTVPVLNFFLQELRNRGCNIRSFKDIMAFYHAGKDTAIQEILKTGLKAGVDLSHFLAKPGQSPRLVAGAIGSRNLLALEEMAVYNQLVGTAIKAAKSNIKAQKENIKLREQELKGQIENEKEVIRNLRSQRNKLSNSLGTDPRASYWQRADVQHRIQNASKHLEALKKERDSLIKRSESLNQEVRALSAAEPVLMQDKITKGLQQEINKAEATQESIRKKIDSYIDATLKKYNGTAVGSSKVIWDAKAGTMLFKVNGVDTKIPLPTWWLDAQKQYRILSNKLSKLKPERDSRKVNPNAGLISKKLKDVQDYSEKLTQINKKITILQETVEKKETLLRREYSNLLKKQRDIVSNAKDKTLPPAYYANNKKIETIRAQLQSFSAYEEQQAKISAIDSKITSSKQRIEEIKKNPEDIKEVIINGKVVSVGITDNGKSAYYLTLSGKLGRKLPSNLWDSSKGTFRSSVQLADYNPSKKEFKVLSTAAVMKDKSLLDDMTIIPIKMGLYTGVTKAGQGFVIRAHTSRFLDAEEFLQFGKDKIFSVSELSSTIGKWFGKESGGANYFSEFGTAHHKVMEDIAKGKLQLNSQGTVDPHILKLYLRKNWIFGDAETKADLRALFEKGSANKISEASFLVLENTVNGVLKQFHSRKVPVSAILKANELTLGAILKVDGIEIPLSGTLDQLWVWGNQLRIADFKTSKEIGPEYVLQLSFYRLLVRALGPELREKFGIRDISNKMTIWMTPATLKKVGGIVDIDAMSDKELASFARDSWTALTEKNPQKKELLVKEIKNKWFEKVDTHIGRRIVDAEVQTKHGKEVRHFINGQTIGDIGAELNRRYPIPEEEVTHWKNYQDYVKLGLGKNMTFEEYLKDRGSKVWKAHEKAMRERYNGVKNYINSLSTAEDRKHLKNLLFLRGENGGFLYNNPIFNDYRMKERPELHSIISRTKSGFKTIRIQNAEGKMQDVKVRIEGGQLTLNEEWMKNASDGGIFYQGVNQAATFGNLSSRDWLRLFRSTDLQFLYNARTSVMNLTPKKINEINEAIEANKVYERALSSLSKTALDQLTGGKPTKEKAEGFYALKAFLNSLQKTYEEAEKTLSENKGFIDDLQRKYASFLKQNKTFKNYSLSEYVREYTDEKTKQTFNSLLDFRASQQLLSNPALKQLIDFKDLPLNERPKDLTDSITILEDHLGYNIDEEHISRTEFQYYRDEEVEESVSSMLGKPKFVKEYSKYSDDRRDEITAQLPHRVARMLTRYSLGKMVYTRMYEEYKKASGAKALKYEDFIKSLPYEQRSEYTASKELSDKFQQALSSGNAGKFLLDLAKENAIGTDTESKDLLSLIKSIASEAPEILTSPSVLKELALQFNGAKMLRYSRFSVDKLARLGLPLTLVGKDLDSEKKGTPFYTFERTSKELIESFQKGEFDKLSSLVNRIARVSLSANPDEGKASAIESAIRDLLEKYESTFPILGVFSERVKQLFYAASQARSQQENINELDPSDPDDAEEIKALKEEKTAQALRITQAQLGLGKLFPLIEFFKKNLLGLGESYEGKVGREAVIAFLRAEYAKVDRQYLSENEDRTKAFQEAIKQEVKVTMANKETNQLLKQILELLSSGKTPVGNVNPNDIEGMNEPASTLLLSPALTKEQKTIREKALEERKLELNIIKEQKKVSEAKNEAEKRMAEGGVKWLQDSLATMKNTHNKEMGLEGNIEFLNKMRAKVKEESLAEEKELYAGIFNRYLDAEDLAKQEIQKYQKEMGIATKEGKTDVLAVLRDTFLPNAKLHLATAEKNTQAFFDQYPEIPADIKTHLQEIKSIRDKEFADKSDLEAAKEEDKARIEREQNYLKLIEKEKDIKQQIAALNVKIAGADEITAMSLNAQKRGLNKDRKAAEKASWSAYNEYKDIYGADIDGNVFTLAGEILSDPDKALKGANKAGNISVLQAKRKHAEEEYNASLEKQLKLYQEIYDIQSKISARQRVGDDKSVEILEKILGKKMTQFDEADKKTQGNLDSFLSLFRGKKQKEKALAALKLFSNEKVDIDQEQNLKNSKDDFGALEQAKSQYRALKRQYETYFDQLNRNDIKFRTTRGSKERSALDVQAAVISENLTEVSEQLENFQKGAKNIQGFAAAKDKIDKQFADIQAKNIANANVAFKGENTLFGKLTTSFKGMIYQFTQFGAAYKIIGAVKKGISDIVASAKALDKAMADLRIVTGQTGSEAKNTMLQFSNLASQLGVTTAEVAKSATAWLRQGYDMAQVTDLVTSSMYLSKLGMISVDEATQGLTSTLKGFKLEAREAIDIVDKFTALDVKAATTAGEIATGLAQFANLASMSGISVDQASAMVATIADVSQVSGAQAGNSLKMMLSRYGTVKSGKFSSMEGEGDTEALNDVEKVLTKIGISMRDTNGQFREFDDVLDAIAEKWDNLDNISQAAVATAIAGTRQREAFLVLMQNMDKYKRFTEISESSSGTAEKKYQSYQEHMQAAQNRLAAAWEKIAQNADIASFITQFINFATVMVKIMPTFLNTVTRLVSIWQGFRIPTLLQQGVQFTGASHFFGSVRGLFKKGGLGHAIEKGNEDIRAYVTGESNRFGGSQVDEWIKRISEQVDLIVQRYQGQGQGSQVSKDAEAVENASEQMANNAQAAAVSTEEGVTNEQLKTAEGVKQVNLERQETQSTGGGNGGAGNRVSVYAGKDGKAMKAAAIASGMAGIVSGVMTTGGSHYSVNGSPTESSGTASGVMKGVSAGVNAVGMVGYAWGPIVGMITQTVASMLDQFLTPLIGMWIDADRDRRNARVEAAEKQLSSLEAIKSAVSNIESTVTSKGLSYEENQELTKQMRELRSVLIENKDVLARVAALMKGYDDPQKIYDKINDWVNLSEQERQEFVNAFEAAISASVGNTTLAAAENDFFDVSKKAEKMRELYYSKTRVINQSGQTFTTSRGNKEIFDPFYAWAIENGVNVDYVNKDQWHTGTPSVTEEKKAAFTTTGQELINQYKSFIDYLAKKDVTKYANIIKQYEKVIQDYEANLAQINEIYREANENLVAAALVTSEIRTSNGKTNLLTANMDQLKRAGKEGIYNAVVEQLVANGGLRGYAVESKEGKSIIEQAIKSNEKLYAVWTGQIYTLKEALSTQNTEVLKSFATALGVSVEELSNLKDELGDLKLADILDSPSATRSKISELTSLFTSMASSSGMTAENMETIINKFPELVHNLKDGVALGGDMLNLLNQYNALYSRQILEELLSNEDYYADFKKKLKETSEDAYNDLIDNSNYKGARDARGILGLLAGSFEESGLQSEESYELLKSLYSEYFDFTTKSSLGTEVFDTYVSYWNKVWDKQISNLEEQKTALQEINKQREYENKLVEARLRLENAAKEKKRVYREGVGWVYEADQNAVKEAQENLEAVEREQTISELEKQIEEITYIKETLNNIAENNELANLESSWKSFIGDTKLSDYASVTKLSGQFTALTEQVVKGFDAVVNYEEAKKTMYDFTYGEKGSSWAALQEAERGMAAAAGQYGKNSKAYYNAQTAYNEALDKYQKDSQDYTSRYGDANLTDEQKSYLTKEHVADSRGLLMIKSNDSYKGYKTGEQILNGSPLFDDIEGSAKTKKGQHLQSWIYDPSSGALDLSQGAISTYSDEFNSDYNGKLDNWAAKMLAENPGKGVVFARSGEHDRLGIVLPQGVLNAPSSGIYALEAARRGSLGLHGGPTLLNEEGSEAIITPNGTLTSLPAKTGVIPADVTRGVWQLGELAPSILRALGYNGGEQFVGGSGVVNNSDSVNIGSVYMQVSADEKFDPDRFVELLRAQAALSKNNRR